MSKVLPLPNAFQHTTKIKSKQLKLHSELHSGLVDKSRLHHMGWWNKKVGSFIESSNLIDWLVTFWNTPWNSTLGLDPVFITRDVAWPLQIPRCQNTMFKVLWRKLGPSFALNLPKQFRFWLSTMIHPGPRTSPWNPRDAEVCWRNLRMSFG